MRLRDFFEMIGLSDYRINHNDILISSFGGMLGIVAIFTASYFLFDDDVAVLIVPSMGASAVLLFAAPHAPFSQPWNVVAGHTISAAIGVACWGWIPDPAVAGATSVGLAIAAMYFTRCIHPPGGATALAAVIGSEELHELGFAFVFQPILVNVLVLLVIAIAFNGLFKWRRYPAQFHIKTTSSRPQPAGYTPINHADFVYALSQIDTLVDISEDDLLKIYYLATKRHRDLPHGSADS